MRLRVVQHTVPDPAYRSARRSPQAPSPPCAHIARVPERAARAEAPNQGAGSIAVRWSSAACTPRTARPAASRTPDSSHSPAHAPSRRRVPRARGTPPGAQRCSSGSGTPARREQPARAVGAAAAALTAAGRSSSGARSSSRDSDRHREGHGYTRRNRPHTRDR